jgi:3-carboxy-cis,cis-muconate cycloisomerase
MQAMTDAQSLSLVDTMFATPAVCEALTDDSHLSAIVAFERALAAAESAAGILDPADADIIRTALANYVLPRGEDRQRLFSDARKAGTIVVPFAKRLTAAVQAVSPEAAGYVHFGATSQDAIDTAHVLQTRTALAAIRRDARGLCAAATSLSERHRNTLMLGRTLLQPATPISFGLKAAQWLTGIAQSIERIDRAAASALVLQFGGAAGTLGSLRDKGSAVATALARELGLPLPVPALPWHARRGALTALGAELGILCGMAGKIARDLSLMMQFELAEAFEAAGEGRGGSSAMPHKRNPVHAMVALANATRAPGLVASLLSGLVEEHERALGPWQAEWALWPDLLRCTSGGVAAMEEALGGLDVDADRMARNLAALRGLPLTEAVSLALAPKLGRQTAHAIVEAAARSVATSGGTLADHLAADPRLGGVIDHEEMNALLNPASALGSSGEFIDRALAYAKKVLGPDG